MPQRCGHSCARTSWMELRPPTCSPPLSMLCQLFLRQSALQLIQPVGSPERLAVQNHERCANHTVRLGLVHRGYDRALGGAILGRRGNVALCDPGDTRTRIRDVRNGGNIAPLTKDAFCDGPCEVV